MRISRMALSVLFAFATVAASVSGTQCEVVGGKKVCQIDDVTTLVQTKVVKQSNFEGQGNAEEGSSESEESSVEDNAEAREDKEKPAFSAEPKQGSQLAHSVDTNEDLGAHADDFDEPEEALEDLGAAADDFDEPEEALLNRAKALMQGRNADQESSLLKKA